LPIGPAHEENVMTAIAIRLLKHTSTIAAAIMLAWALTPSLASAQVIERGIQGGVTGAIIGGIIGGGKGAGRGAAIGAYYGPPPPGSNLVYDTQSALLRLGYNPGPPDGVYGQRTAEAISQYQYTYRLPVNGQPSPQLLDHMIHNGG
jgi:hypothetical protein